MRLIKRCCCGCPLRTVTLIIGYIHVLILTVVLLTAIAFSPGDDRIIRSSYSPVAEGFAFTAISAALFIIISVLLIIGAMKGNILLLLPWIGNTMVGVVAAALAWIYGLVKVGASPFAALVTFIFFFILGISFLSLLVVVSHFEELRKEIMNGSKDNNSTTNIEARISALEATVDNLGQTV